MTVLPNAKGKRPAFAEDPQIDKLVSIVMALTQELAVVRERCDTYERVLAEKQLVGVTEWENYRPTPEVEIAREQWRRDYLDRILWIMGPAAEQSA